MKTHGVWCTLTETHTYGYRRNYENLDVQFSPEISPEVCPFQRKFALQAHSLADIVNFDLFGPICRTSGEILGEISGEMGRLQVKTALPSFHRKPEEVGIYQMSLF